jgi:Domain of unknown function (DUF1906)
MRRVAIVLTLLAGTLVPAAAPAAQTETIHFRGETVRAPASWPVIRLAERPRTCVRLDRRAVYLGAPRPEQRCPASAIGKRRAIVVDPGAERREARAQAQASRVPPARISAASNFTGLGFDACAAPSGRTMRAWASSPYRAIGVYIGGINRACSQPNLTASWVAARIAAGWSLIPTYVGLQAPTSVCGSCAKLSAAAATVQGRAAAKDAVADAKAVGIGPGSPIYNDMEAYSRTSSATKATLAFLAAWTEQLHDLGYDSGVYSSAGSGIRDLVGRLGTGYLQPDDIWIANWDGRRTTDDPYVPDSAWSNHERIRQYRGGHNETWGGVTINIDNNFVEGATAGTAGPTLAGPDDPQGSFDSVSAPAPGQIQLRGWAFDPSAPRKPVALRAYVGGKGAGPNGALHELGPIAVLPRPDVAARHKRAGEEHGFDAGFPIVGSGRTQVCLYALDIGAGEDSLLGCRHVGVPPPLTVYRIAPKGGNSVRVGVRCEWPAGVACPGQIVLRARVKVRVKGARASARRGRARTRVVKKAIARRGFRLSGGQAWNFRVVLGKRGRLLTRDRKKLGAQLVVAIPGSRAFRRVKLR